MAGLRPQAAPWNFLHEVLDLRWIQDCRRCERPEDSTEVPKALMCDIRQAWHHQASGPSMTILTSSVGFNYRRKRTLAPKEMLMQQGWPRGIINLEKFDVIPPNFPWSLVGSEKAWSRRMERAAQQPDAAEQSANKVRRCRGPRLQAVDTQVVHLAGNGMVVAEMCKHGFTAALVSEDDTLFEHPCDMSAILAMLEGCTEELVVKVDPARDDVRGVRRQVVKLETTDAGIDDGVCVLDLDDDLADFA